MSDLERALKLLDDVVPVTGEYVTEDKSFEEAKDLIRARIAYEQVLRNAAHTRQALYAASMWAARET